MKGSALERSVSVANKLFDSLDKFYDEGDSKWYIEAAKHMVPTYTVHRMSNTGSEAVTILGGVIDIVKIFGYVYTINQIFLK